MSTNARNTDPDTSHMAAESIQATIGARMTEVLAFIRRHPHKTARELEHLATGEITPVDTVHKRISDLASKGLIRSTSRRSCSITGRQAHVWVPTQERRV